VALKWPRSIIHQHQFDQGHPEAGDHGAALGDDKNANDGRPASVFSQHSTSDSNSGTASPEENTGDSDSLFANGGSFNLLSHGL
jgi:hypothetical protein